ncbi:MAG: PEP-CTERM sorting domain-containing protein [Crocosphaera sp.]|nr:PEP-CTERM sorting domain-containing protein [Crocosphaera sp.]
MKSYVPKVLLMTAIVLGGVIGEINPSSAQNISYNLNFFDNSGVKIGDGGFSYDLSTSTCIQEIPFGNSCNEMNGFFVETELTDFSANILGTIWGLNDRAGQLWWHEEDENQPGTVMGAIAGRSGIFIGDQWFFGDQFFNENFLAINGENGGGWKQVLDTNNFLAGTWTAVLDDDLSPNSHTIPEPLTVLGVATALGFGTFFKLKLK